MRTGGVILCGGGSQRMGRDKASLPFGPGETLLSAVAHRVGEATGNGPIVCVAAVGQPLPSLPDTVAVVRDRSPDLGPLEGAAVGLAAAQLQADAVVLVGCDAPLVSPDLLRMVLDRLPANEAVAPVVEGHRQPLLAAYDAAAAAKAADELLATGARSLQALLDRLTLAEVSEAEWRAVDPERHSLLNCNTEEAYQRALLLAEL